MKNVCLKISNKSKFEKEEEEKTRATMYWSLWYEIHNHLLKIMYCHTFSPEFFSLQISFTSLPTLGNNLINFIWIKVCALASRIKVRILM